VGLKVRTSTGLSFTGFARETNRLSFQEGGGFRFLTARLIA